MRGTTIYVALVAAGCGGTQAPSTTEVVAEPEAAEAATAVPEPELDPLTERCDALGQAAQETLAMDDLIGFVRAEDAEVAERIWSSMAEPFGECLDAGEGAWVAVPLALHLLAGGPDAGPAGPNAPGVQWELLYTIAFIAPDGTERRMVGEPKTLHHDISDDIPEGRLLVTYPPQDLDGDGVGELALVEAAFGPDYSESKDTILQVRDGDLRPFDAYGEMRLRDVDEDGRFDVLIQRPWRCTFYNDMEGESYEAGCPWVMLHGTEGGVSTDDDAARAHMRSQCRQRPTRLISEDPPEDCWPVIRDDAMNVACARIWGASVAEVQAQVRREYARMRRACQSEADLAALLAHAEHEPPFTLE